MDTSVSRCHRPAAQPEPFAPHAAQAAPPPGSASSPAARERMLPGCDAPHAADGGRPPEDSGPYDLGKVARNALAAGSAFGLTFGTATAIKHALRHTAGMPLPLKVVGGLLPMASLLVSPQVEDGMRELLGTQASYPPEPSLAHDALSPLALTLMNAGYISTRFLKLPPTTFAGAAATVFKTALASVPAGGASEADAQRRQASAQREGRDPQPHDHVDPARKGMGRAASQIPAAAVNTYVTVRNPSLAVRRPMVPVLAVTAGWTFRRTLMPPGPDLAMPPALAAASAVPEGAPESAPEAVPVIGRPSVALGAPSDGSPLIPPA